MQITHYKPRIIERHITTENGKFLARFVVVSEGKSFKLKLVEMIPAVEASLSSAPLLLSLPKIIQIFGEILTSMVEVVSPYANLLFLVSQPTRAPSF